jgi:raffinose/stachyose/melibiose transport system permease protein
LFRDDANISVYLILTIIFFLQIIPLSTMFINSFRRDTTIKAAPMGLPDLFSFQNWLETWVIGRYGQAFINSIFIAICVIGIIVFFAGFAAYAMVKLNLPGRNFFVSYFLMVMAIPTFLYIIPVYYLFNSIGLVNNQMGMIVVYSANFMPFNLLLIRTYLIGIPGELEEAARVDGCDEIATFFRITLPLAKPIFITVTLLVFVNCWNEFLWANTFLIGESVGTVSIRFIKFTGEHTKDLAKVFTAGCIAVLPIILLYLALQRQFVEGITAGSVKG